jgi:hypothetical protein
MFLRRNRRLVDGETYEYWTLVRTVRTARGPRQEIVATLGVLSENINAGIFKRPPGNSSSACRPGACGI